MPGQNCAIPQCHVYYQKGGLFLHDITKQDDDGSKNWKEKLLNIVYQYREVDINFKQQVQKFKVAICERHYKESCLIRRKFNKDYFEFFFLGSYLILLLF